jgi:hypothetical protein
VCFSILPPTPPPLPFVTTKFIEHRVVARYETKGMEGFHIWFGNSMKSMKRWAACEVPLHRPQQCVSTKTATVLGLKNSDSSLNYEYIIHFRNISSYPFFSIVSSEEKIIFKLRNSNCKLRKKLPRSCANNVYKKKM